MKKFSILFLLIALTQCPFFTQAALKTTIATDNKGKSFFTVPNPSKTADNKGGAWYPDIRLYIDRNPANSDASWQENLMRSGKTCTIFVKKDEKNSTDIFYLNEQPEGLGVSKIEIINPFWKEKPSKKILEGCYDASSIEASLHQNSTQVLTSESNSAQQATNSSQTPCQCAECMNPQPPVAPYPHQQIYPNPGSYPVTGPINVAFPQQQLMYPQQPPYAQFPGQTHLSSHVQQRLSYPQQFLGQLPFSVTGQQLQQAVYPQQAFAQTHRPQYVPQQPVYAQLVPSQSQYPQQQNNIPVAQPILSVDQQGHPFRPSTTVLGLLAQQTKTIEEQQETITRLQLAPLATEKTEDQSVLAQQLRALELQMAELKQLIKSQSQAQSAPVESAKHTVVPTCETATSTSQTETELTEQPAIAPAAPIGPQENSFISLEAIHTVQQDVPVIAETPATETSIISTLPLPDTTKTAPQLTHAQKRKSKQAAKKQEEEEAKQKNKPADSLNPQDFIPQQELILNQQHPFALPLPVESPLASKTLSPEPGTTASYTPETDPVQEEQQERALNVQKAPQQPTKKTAEQRKLEQQKKEEAELEKAELEKQKVAKAVDAQKAKAAARKRDQELKKAAAARMEQQKPKITAEKTKWEKEKAATLNRYKELAQTGNDTDLPQHPSTIVTEAELLELHLIALESQEETTAIDNAELNHKLVKLCGAMEKFASSEKNSIEERRKIFRLLIATLSHPTQLTEKIFNLAVTLSNPSEDITTSYAAMFFLQYTRINELGSCIGGSKCFHTPLSKFLKTAQKKIKGFDQIPFYYFMQAHSCHNAQEGLVIAQKGVAQFPKSEELKTLSEALVNLVQVQNNELQACALVVGQKFAAQDQKKSAASQPTAPSNDFEVRSCHFTTDPAVQENKPESFADNIDKIVSLKNQKGNQQEEDLDDAQLFRVVNNQELPADERLKFLDTLVEPKNLRNKPDAYYLQCATAYSNLCNQNPEVFINRFTEIITPLLTDNELKWEQLNKEQQTTATVILKSLVEFQIGVKEHTVKNLQGQTKDAYKKLLQIQASAPAITKQAIEMLMLQNPHKNPYTG